MKYVRNIEDLKRYTFEFFDSFLPKDLSDKMVNNFLLGLGCDKGCEEKAVELLSKSDISLDIIPDYGEVILQLNDYKNLLKNYVELLLKAKKFEHLCMFLNRIFLQQIGDAKYKSVRRMYSIRERYFDRFVEICMYCQIDKSLFMPFFLGIFNSDSKSLMFFYKEPLKEYLDNFLKDGEDDEFISKLVSTENKESISEFALQNTNKTLSVLLKGFVYGEITNTSIIKKALAEHKQEAFNIIEEYLGNDDSDVKYKATQLLILLRDDRRVKDRLKFLYDTTTSTKIKQLLEKECNFNSLIKFETKEEFFNFVDEAVPQIQERLYGARLTRYYKNEGLNNTGIDGKTLTFVMETFKNREADSQLVFLKSFFRFVDDNMLTSLANVVYEVAVYREKLISSKWALRLIAVFGDKKLLEKMTFELENWFNNNRTIVVAKYFIDLLAECGREELIDILKALLESKLDKKQIRYIQNKIEELSKSSKQKVEDVKDKLTFDLGFDENGGRVVEVTNRTLKLQIQPDCSVALINPKNNKPARLHSEVVYEGLPFKKYLKNLEKLIKKQKRRLFQSFLEFRNYDVKTFEDCILKNNLLNFLSKNLIWARYKKDKLAEICILKDNKLEHLMGNVILDDFDSYTIALMQPYDINEQKDRLRDRVGKTLFNQIDFPVFDSSHFSGQSNCVDSFSGFFCDAKLFVTRLEKIKYKINNLDNKNEYSMLAKENKNLNLITTIEFNKLKLNNEVNSTTINEIRFYDLNKVSKSGKNFMLDKKDAKMLADMEPHVLSNELAQIFLASKS